jgi:hypothetical protein
MTKTSDEKTENPVSQRYVFGLENGKPVGARFPQSEIKAFEVAKVRNLEAHEGYNEEWTALGMQLPVGRVYARGKAFIPAIPKALYEKLQAALARWAEEGKRSQSKPTADATAARENKSTSDNPPSDAAALPVFYGFPRTWEEIAPGHLVLAEEPGEGWWASLVVGRENEIVTLRFRDYPKVPKFNRHISAVALVNPGPA